MPKRLTKKETVLLRDLTNGTQRNLAQGATNLDQLVMTAQDKLHLRAAHAGAGRQCCQRQWFIKNATATHACRWDESLPAAAKYCFTSHELTLTKVTSNCRK